MQDDNRPSSDLPLARLTTADTDVQELSDFIAVPVTTETLIKICHLVQQWIPGFTQLSLKERRSMARAGNLDPEFIQEGIATALAAGAFAAVLTQGMNGDECRDLNATIRSNEELEREYMVLIKGLAATILQQKCTLGDAVLNLYANLGFALRGSGDQLRHLQPYYDRMKAAYKKGRTGGRKAKAETQPE